MEPSKRDKLESLTRRQRQVLALRCEGKKLAEIADVIGREERTVKDHMANIYRRLGIAELEKPMRDFELFDYCRLLPDVPKDVGPSDEAESAGMGLVPGSERALIAVMEDELALVSRQPIAIIPRAVGVQSRSSGYDSRDDERGRRINPFMLLFVTALGASLVSAAIVAVVMSQMRAPANVIERQVVVTVPPVEFPDQSQAGRVVPMAPPAPATAVPAPPAPPTQAPTVPPAPPTATPVPEIPSSGTVAAGERLRLQNLVYMTIRPDSYSGREVRARITNESDRPFILRLNKEGIRVVDNLGRRSPITGLGGPVLNSLEERIDAGRSHEFRIIVERRPDPDTTTWTFTFENISGARDLSWIYSF
jgi:hypothetical protein